MQNNKIFSADFRQVSYQDYLIMKSNLVYQDDCPVDYSRLNIITLCYYDFDGIFHNDGKIMVFDVVTDYVINIFSHLFQIKFPIHKISLMDCYNGNDDLSMADNNSSAFNYRKILNTNIVSSHSYGTAIDINPIQNPYIVIDKENAIAKFLPKSSIEYINRCENRMGKNKRFGMAEQIKEVFYNNGFLVWGGDWDDPVDYQHFQIEKNVSELLINLDYIEGKRFFDLYVAFYRKHKRTLLEIVDGDLKELYKSPIFWQIINDKIK